MYFASICKEESRPVRFNVVYLDPKNPDPTPPPRIRNDRWNFVPFIDPLPWSIQNLIKLSHATDPRTSCLVVFPDRDDQLFVWGLVDQQNSFNLFINLDRDSGFVPPGLFYIGIRGVAHIEVGIEGDKIAQLKLTSLAPRPLDVLAYPPVFSKLETGVGAYISEVHRRISSNGAADLKSLGYLSHYWLSAIRRLLLRTQGHGHGAAFLITPEARFVGLNLKYRMNYQRLRAALIDQAVNEVTLDPLSDRIFEEYLERGEDVPSELYFEELRLRDEEEDNRNELDGCLWFVSLLSRVDGLVLLTRDLDVTAFGVEIMVTEEPRSIYRSASASASPKKLTRIRYNEFGTRHRSMMRYCWKVPESVGFVISQDGGLRVMTRVDENLVIWDNVSLQLHEFVGTRRGRKSNTLGDKTMEPS